MKSKHTHKMKLLKENIAGNLVDLRFAVVQSLSCVQLLATPWTVACKAPLSVEILQARILEWVAIYFARGSSRPTNRTRVSCIAGRVFTE